MFFAIKLLAKKILLVAEMIPDQPLVDQTINDCLTEAMDIDELIEFIEKIKRRTDPNLERFKRAIAICSRNYKRTTLCVLRRRSF